MTTHSYEIHPESGRRDRAAARLDDLARALGQEFDAAFRFYDGLTGEPVGNPSSDHGPRRPGRESTVGILAAAADGRAHVVPSRFDCYRLVVPFPEPDGSFVVAVADLPAFSRSPDDFRREQSRLQRWANAVHPLFLSRVRPPLVEPGLAGDERRFSITLKTLLEVGDLLRGVELQDAGSQSPSEILDRASAIVAAETLLWVPPGLDQPVVIHGEPRLTCPDGLELAALLVKQPGWDESGSLILNNVQSAVLRARFPHIANVMAISNDAGHASGALIAVNKKADRLAGLDADAAADHGHRRTHEAGSCAFRRLDSALLIPFAAMLGGQSRRARRNRQTQELFTGLTRSLVAAIDAKDTYTCGHSERVGRIAVEIGRELGLRDIELSDLYLGGLLHDIGKIGVSDAILCKPDPLSPWEFDQIRQHVIIGFRILADFRAVSHLLPLILYHHERFDGTGYPEGLRSDEIPLAARILAVADGYDAMISSRPYRKAMCRQTVEQNLELGRDLQWDGRVVDAFFRVRERVYTIQHMGVGNSICFALDNAFRSEDARADLWPDPVAEPAV